MSVTFRILRTLVWLVVPVAASAKSLVPTTYSMENGELGPGGLLYRDDLYRGKGDARTDRSALSGGLGQLSDGVTGCHDDPTADCGSGRGYEWVGWRDDPTITFGFGPLCDFKTVRIYSANRPGTGAPLWTSVVVSFSDDGLRFRDDVVFEPSTTDRQDPKCRYIDIPVKSTARIVRLHFVRSGGRGWLLISDVEFEGNIAVHQVEPVHP